MTTASERADSRDEPWPLRPWIMALLCAVAGLAFYLLVDKVDDTRATSWRVVGASFVAVATLSFVLTVEWRRAWWSLAFALAWGLIVGMVGWTTHNYNGHGEVLEFPFLASIFAVLLACPLFQTARDEGAFRFTSGSVHNHAWTDAVIGAASIAFVGIAFLLAWLIAGLFDLIGIDVLKEWLQEGDFGFALAGFAFGASVGILRERDALVGTMQRLVMVVLGVLAPVLAAALLIFLLSLPLTGFAKLWDSWVSAAALTLAAAGGAYLLLNAAIGLGDEDKPTNRILHWAALVLALVVLPLAALAIAALVTRVNAYGWTPERIWAVVCAGIALVYGAAGWWAVGRGRMEFAPLIRTLQTRLALGMCGVALILALPIVDFGAISARDQLARLRSGATELADFDWQAMAFDFGPAGRAALQRMARSGPEEQRTAARDALAADNRYDLPAYGDMPGDARPLAQRLRVLPEGRALTPEALRAIEGVFACRRGTCVALWVDEDRIAVLSQQGDQDWVYTNYVSRNSQGAWGEGQHREAGRETPRVDDLSNATIAVTERSQRQISIDGQVLQDIDDTPQP